MNKLKDLKIKIALIMCTRIITLYVVSCKKCSNVKNKIFPNFLVISYIYDI